MAATGGEVKLLGAPMSPFVMRVRVALNLKAIDYEFLEEQRGSKSELLLKSNPVHKKMPVLLHRDRPICESLIIVQYIDETWPAAGASSILPADPYDRATTRFWAAYIDDKWFPSLIGIMKAPSEEAKAELAGQVKEGLQLLEEAFEKLSKGKAFFGGDTVGYVDIALGSFLTGLKACDKVFGFNFLDSEKIPKLVGWADRFQEDAAVKEVWPDVDKMAWFIQNVLLAQPSPPAN